MRWSILFFFVPVLAIDVAAEGLGDTLNWRHITIEDGLPNSYVSAICQDRHGFIWIGTQDGLSRYDGYAFENYEHLPTDTNSLSNNFVTALLEDSEGQLWVGTQNGLNRLRKDRAGFTRFLHIPDDSTSLANNHIKVIFEDSDRRIWVGNNDGTLHLFDRQTGGFARFPLSGQSDLRDMIEDRHGRLILGFRHAGLISFNKEQRRFHTGVLYDPTRDVPAHSLLEDRDGDLWIGARNGLYRYRENEGRLDTFPTNPKTPGLLNCPLTFDLYETESGHIWISTDGGGINILDKEKGVCTYVNTNEQRQGLNSLAVTRIFQDRDGVLWAGTVNAGLNRQMKHESLVDHYTYEKGNPTGLSGKFVQSMHESKNGDIWIGLDQGGVNYLDRSTERFTHFLHNPEDPNSLIENVINSVYEDSRGDLYIGTYLNGFDILRNSERTFEHHWHKKNPDSPRPRYIRYFLEDSYGDFWIGSVTQGLIRYDRDTKESVFYNSQSEAGNAISSDHITYLFEDQASNLWVGTIGGLNRFNRERGEFRAWLHSPTDSTSISGNLILSISEDEEGVLWIGTDKGLDRFDQQRNIFTHYTTAHGLPGNWVKAILPGSAGELWLLTNRGICRFFITDGSIEPLNIGEDVSIQGYAWGGLKTKDGKLWFGTVNGIYSFYPDKIRKNPLIPPVVITKLRIGNREVHPGKTGSPLQAPVSDTRELVLDHQQSRVFSFEFVALNYIRSSQNQYAYKLAGFEEDWNYVGHQRNATYTNLDPGQYIFRVKASNNDGLWNEEGASIRITILAPWWKSWQAYLLYTAALLATGLGIWYSEKTRMKLLHNLKLAKVEKEKEAELSRMKSQFFTNISHEFKTPLTLIVGPLERIISSGRGDAYMKRQFHLMYQNTNRLLDLIDQLMDFRRAEAGRLKLQARESDLTAFTRNTVNAFAERAKDSDIVLNFQAPEGLLPLWFDSKKLDKVLFNLLSNAVRHTKAGGRIDVSVRPAADAPGSFAEIVVQDTGSGIAPEEQGRVFERFYQVSPENGGSGIGLSLSKTLVELHRGDIRLESEVGKGSAFTVRLPLGKAHLSESELAFPQQADRQARINNAIPAAIAQKLVAPPNPAIKSHKLLIVEDDAKIRAFLRETLETFYSVVEAPNGQEGLNKAQKSGPDLIISDVLMPEMDGFAFCKQIKTNLQTSHIPVILLTALTGEESHLKGLDTGADAYVTKPFNPRLLLARVKNLLELRKKLRERFLFEFNIAAKEVTITSVDEQFMQQTIEIVEAHMGDPEFNVETLVGEMAMSRSVFSKKLKALAGMPPGEFIRTIKLKRAAQLLLKSGKNISEIAYELGFVTPKTFRTQFKKHFGQTPSEFIAMRNTEVES